MTEGDHSTTNEQDTTASITIVIENGHAAEPSYIFVNILCCPYIIVTIQTRDTALPAFALNTLKTSHFPQTCGTIIANLVYCQKRLFIVMIDLLFPVSQEMIFFQLSYRFSLI
ncbi:MAG: hypothetical protein V2I36_13945 [Desulfopila sp.]|jgi:hypothetical protein|nr:hypothetical protein [Desulfopila sp.]